MKGFLFISTRHETIGIFNFFALSTTNALQGTSFWKKDDFCHKYFKFVHAQSLNVPHYMVRDVFIYNQGEAFGI